MCAVLICGHYVGEEEVAYGFIDRKCQILINPNFLFLYVTVMSGCFIRLMALM